MAKFKVGDKVRVIDGGRHLNTDNPFMEAYAWSRECGCSPAPEPPKFYTGKVFAEKSDDVFFAARDGRVFEFVDGECINPVNGSLFIRKYTDFANLCKECSHTKWHEVKSDV